MAHIGMSHGTHMKELCLALGLEIVVSLFYDEVCTT